MKLNKVALANASAVLSAIFYLACFLTVIFMPAVAKSVFLSWFHGIGLDQIWVGYSGGFWLGFISLAIISWITGWLFAWFYNGFIK